MPRGKRWDERAVVGYLRGRVRPSTRNGSGHLPVHIEQKLSEMREQGKMLRELCEWLTAEGWSTRDGRAWHVGTVACIIRRVERDRRRKIALTVAPPQ